MQYQRLPLPPYGKILELYQDQTIQLSFPIYIFVGKNAKQEAYLNKSHGVMSSYIPKGFNFEDFYWPIKDQKVILFDTGASTVMGLNKLCYQILQEGASTVCRYSEIAPIKVFKHFNHTKEVL